MTIFKRVGHLRKEDRFLFFELTDGMPQSLFLCSVLEGAITFSAVGLVSTVGEGSVVSLEISLVTLASGLLFSITLGRGIGGGKSKFSVALSRSSRSGLGFNHDFLN